MAAVNLGNSRFTTYSFQRHIVKTTENLLVVFSQYDYDHLGYKTSSDNGVTWDGSWTDVVNDQLSEFTVYIESNNDIYLIYYDNDTGLGIYFRKLTYSTGTWSVGSEIAVSGAVTNYQALSFAKRSNGDLWISAKSLTTSTDEIKFWYSSDSGSTWNTITDLVTSYSNLYAQCIIEKDTNIWCFVSGDSKLKVYEYTTSWDSGTEIVGSNVVNPFGYSNRGLSSLKISNSNIYTAVSTSSGIKIFNYTTSWDSGTILTSSTQYAYSQALTNINDSPVICYYDLLGGTSNQELQYRFYNGSSWDSAVTILKSSTLENSISSIISDFSYLYYIYGEGSGSPYTLYFDKVELGPSSLNVNSDVKFKKIGVTLTTNSDIKFINYRYDYNILSTCDFKLDDTEDINSDVKFKKIGVTLTTNSDSYFVNTLKTRMLYSDIKFKKQLSDTIESDITYSSKYISKYIYNTKMYITTDIIGSEIIEVDLINPNIYDKYELSSIGNNINYAKDLVIDSERDYIYVCADDGKVIKLDKNDLTDLTYYDVNYISGDETQLKTITFNETYKIISTGSEDTRGLLFILDESSSNIFNTDLRLRFSEQNILNTIINTGFNKNINTDIRTKIDSDNTIDTDIRITTVDYDDIIFNLIARSDFHIYISDVQLGNDDLILNSIEIIHNENEPSEATFDLNRKFDYINNPTSITNNETVKIYIKSTLVFEGKIFNVDSNSQNETVSVYCESTDDLVYDMNTKQLALSTLNTKIHPYDVLKTDIKIERPYIDSSDENPPYYKGIKVYLGTEIKQKNIRNTAMSNAVDSLENGTFNFLSGYTYFWTVGGKLYDLTSSPTTFSGRYIGTNLNELSSDLYEITSAYYRYQKRLDDEETDLGYYTLGEAPYKEISTKNGRKISADIWVDKADGLWRETEASYDYIEYAKAIAAIEYNKLLQIQGGILPRTSADIEITIDAFLYYDIKRLNRINLKNTTDSSIYNGNNGFPIAVKRIQISSNAMKVTISGDNSLSDYEITQLDDQYPNSSNYETEASSGRVTSKSSLPH